ncbi:TBC1 domain family member 13-like protein [Drosera capensis]
MVKKGVPDWLNSSLWSSSPSPTPSSSTSSTTADPSSDDSRLRRYPSSKHDRDVVAAEEDSSIRKAPVPQPPPGARSEPKEEAERRDEEQTPTSRDKRDFSPVISAEEVNRQSQLLVEVSKKVVNMVDVRRLVSMGIPDGTKIRPTLWKLLLAYLPTERALWPAELAKKRSQYKHFKDELLMNPSEVARRLEKLNPSNNDYESCGPLSRSEVTQEEHPLSLGKSSIWNHFFQDTEIVEQIDRDVQRTHPDMPFFSEDSPFAKSNRESLRRILIVFAKLNPGIRYVQGMNEILAPLFYIFRNDPDEENVAHAEADTFFCFVELLSGFRDNYCQQLDNSVVGIRSTITKLSQILRDHDEELWRHLEVTCKVNPQFYAFRWITLLLTQEFDFSDCLHIWDSLLSDPEGPQETLLRICCAMLILVRRRLLAGDFTSNLKLLQNYPTTNISHLLYVANKLRARPSS